MTALDALDKPVCATIISALSRSLVTGTGDLGHLNEMLRHLRGLRSLEVCLPDSLVQVPFPSKFVFRADPPLHPPRLTRFVWNQHEQRSKGEMDFFRRFLESRPTLKHLELSKTKFLVQGPPA
ncbi:hypothetical protein CCMSSC00406_0004323 [Pleurotus cornucopiae]|uniref:Uncharacterized protein n=1 Tax=Pleurotus cornucopiae TaxID=5321 RepID=A0ACB7J992_PLECO|nr:hypothetical protein CCMSSC00406_0004323 [Pleurotus cornucopiae]